MALDFTFLSAEQIEGYNSLDLIKKYGVAVSPTDLAVLLGSEVNYFDRRTSEGSLACESWCISSNGSIYVKTESYTGIHSGNIWWRGIAARPALPTSEAFKIRPQNIHKGPHGVQIGEYGEYPQTVADEHIGKKLEKRLKTGSLRPTGKNYTFDSVALEKTAIPFKETSYQEYEMDGKRYIRVPGRPANDNSKLSTGEQVEVGKPYWVEVQPIEWLMDESGWMVAKKCLFSGIQFSSGMGYNADFSKTSIKHYLDTYFAKEMEPSKTIERTKSKKGLTALLSSQEREEIENDENVTLFRKVKKAVIEQALEGTKKLKGKEKRKAELAILRKTNVQALRDAEGKARAKKMVEILKKKQSTK